MTGRKHRRLRPQFVLLCILLALVLANASILTLRLVRSRSGGSGGVFSRKPEADGVMVPDYVTENLLPANRYSRPGYELTDINGVVIHYVGNPATSAEANRNYFASLADGREGTFASSHFIVGLEGEVIQCIPLTEMAYASRDRNSDTVAIEVCHPDETGEFSDVTYASVVELTAWLCRTFALEPENDVIRHYDVTEKLCPLYYVEHPDAWDTFRADVAAAAALAAEEAIP